MAASGGSAGGSSRCIDRSAGGAEQFRGGPELFILGTGIAIAAGADAFGVVGVVVIGVRHQPAPGGNGRIEAALGVLGVVVAIDSTCDGADGREIGGGGGGFEGHLAIADDQDRIVVILRHDEAGELCRGGLVPDAAILVLHLEHPVKIPADLGEEVGDLAAGFRDVEVEFPKLVHVEFVCPEQ